MKKKLRVLVIVLVILIILIFGFSYKFRKRKVIDSMPYLLSEKSKILEKDLKKGMTIKDEYDNEWVWIVVPKSKVFKTAMKDTDYENILKDIKNYTKDYKIEDVYEIKDNRLMNSVLKSIFKYGGFYISRYEIGSEKIRKNKNDNLETPYSKKDLYVYNNVDFKQAEDLSTKISNRNYKSNLLFGFQIDLVFKFMEENGYNRENQKIIKEMITSNSSSWGNYYSSSFIINRGKYSADSKNNYVDITESLKKNAYSNWLLTTGASDENKVCNIYDFAGNVSEWSLEQIRDETGEWNVIRDGNFYFNYGGNDPASGRYKLDSSSVSDSYGFRVMCIK